MAKGSVHQLPSAPEYQSGRRAATQFYNAKPKMTKEDLKKDIERRRARDEELVSGVFKNYETPGGGLSFKLCLYPGDPFDTYELRDGERYTLPRGVARHLNNGCYIKKYRHVENNGQREEMFNAMHNGQGNLSRAKNIQFAEKIHRFGFNPLDYMSDDDLDILPSKSILEVSVSP